MRPINGKGELLRVFSRVISRSLFVAYADVTRLPRFSKRGNGWDDRRAVKGWLRIE